MTSSGAARHRLGESSSNLAIYQYTINTRPICPRECSAQFRTTPRAPVDPSALSTRVSPRATAADSAKSTSLAKSLNYYYDAWRAPSPGDRSASPAASGLLFQSAPRPVTKTGRVSFVFVTAAAVRARSERGQPGRHQQTAPAPAPAAAPVPVTAPDRHDRSSGAALTTSSHRTRIITQW